MKEKKCRLDNAITANKSFMKEYFSRRNNVPRDTSTKVSTYKISCYEFQSVSERKEKSERR